jgi:hypothetical protein
MGKASNRRFCVTGMPPPVLRTSEAGWQTGKISLSRDIV